MFNPIKRIDYTLYQSEAYTFYNKQWTSLALLAEAMKFADCISALGIRSPQWLSWIWL